MADGYIKWYRSILDWEWWDDLKVSRTFETLALLANHDEQKWHGEIVRRGETITSLAKLAAVSTLSERAVRTSLKKLQSTGDIEVKTTNRYTRIKVLNYRKFQDSEIEQRQTNDKQMTNNRQTNDNQTTTNKNDKNDKNEENIYIESLAHSEVVDSKEVWFSQFWNVYPRKTAKAAAQKAFKAKCKTEADFSKIMAALHEQCDQIFSRRDPKYIPYPATWLNAGSYEDVITEPEQMTYEEKMRKKYEQAGNDLDLDSYSFGIPSIRSDGTK